jgi:DNA-binding response OmpR family regulator
VVPAKLILTVGLDTSLLSARNVILQSAGYTTVSAFSIQDAASSFLSGDFDLVVLDDSLPAKDSDRLTSLIRASGSRIPVIAVASQDSPLKSFADTTVEADPIKFRVGVRKVLLRQGEERALFAIANQSGQETR